MAFIPQSNEPDEDKLGDGLPEDNGTPFSPPAAAPDDPVDDTGMTQQAPVLDDTHPVTDSNLDTQEVYDAGMSGAAQASDPGGDDAVTDYNPDHAEDEDDQIQAQ